MLKLHSVVVKAEGVQAFTRDLDLMKRLLSER